VILDDPERSIARYNQIGLHYNLAADGIYRARASIDPFSEEYEPFIIAGLLVFDMGRMMGHGSKYAFESHGFRSRLRLKMGAIREVIGALAASGLHEIDLATHAGAIETAYYCLAETGGNALNADPSKQFHVGATKILHWICPSLFLMVDANVAKAFQAHHEVNYKYKTGTQPGYTAKKYVECLKHTQDEIRSYGFEKLRRIELGTPVARLFDKAAWVAGQSTQHGLAAKET